MRIPDIELMLYRDGELDEEGARRVRLAALYHPEIGARLEGIDRVGALVRAWGESRGADAREMRNRALRSAERRRTFAFAAVALVALAAVAEPVAAPGAVEVTLGASPAVAIESVDFGSHAGTVFVVEAADGVTPVVWLEDDARADG